MGEEISGKLWIRELALFSEIKFAPGRFTNLFLFLFSLGLSSTFLISELTCDYRTNGIRVNEQSWRFWVINVLIILHQVIYYW